MKRSRIGLIGFDGITALDLVGPADAFAAAMTTDREGKTHPCYEVVVLGLTLRPFTAESGVVFKPRFAMDDAPPLDTLVIPGGSGLRRRDVNARVATWVKSREPTLRRVASVCTGIYGLAPTGLLDGRRVTTHWRFAKDIARLFPRLKVDSDAIYLKDGRFYTSAGMTAGIDLSLALIEEDHGPTSALSVARELVVYFKRSGGQEQYSEPLRFQAESADRFTDLAFWTSTHLKHDLSVESLADRVHVSARHFSRRFKSAFGITPAAFVENLRLDEARQRLGNSANTIEGVAVSVGIRNPDVFRRAFQRRFGIAPSAYRVRFGAEGKTSERGARP